MMFKRFILIFNTINFLFGAIAFSSSRYEDLPAYILVDFDGKKNEKILFQKNIYKDIIPASLAKIITAYLVFESIENGIISIDQKVSKEKYKKMKNIDYLFEKSDDIDIKHLLSHLLVRSSNEAAKILAIEILRTEDNFIKAMNDKARKLQMYTTKFFDVSGLDLRNTTEVIDLIVLIKSLNDRFPHFQYLFRMPFYGKNGTVYENRSNIYQMYGNLIGFKTGHLDKCGYHLAVWLEHKNHFYLAIITGAKSEKERDLAMRDLLLKIK